jgi:hypothetical protein
MARGNHVALRLRERPGRRRAGWLRLRRRDLAGREERRESERREREAQGY